MRYKVLTVDDSKTVRIIVKKAFKPFDVEIYEAANGASKASRLRPRKRPISSCSTSHARHGRRRDAHELKSDAR